MRRAVVTSVSLVMLSGCAWVERVSIPTGHPVTPGVFANGASASPAISDGGRFVAFESTASNLVPGDTNGTSDVFVRDAVTDTTELVSVSSNEVAGLAASTHPSISDDGRYVAFATRSQFAASDVDSASDIYVRDRLLGTTSLISTNIEPQPAPSPASLEAAPFTDPTISGDGSVIAFNATVDTIGFPVLVGPFVARIGEPVKRMTQGQLFPTRASLSDDGTRIAWTSIAPVGQADANIVSVIADTTTNSLVAEVDGGFVTHQSQAGFSISLAGDGNHAVTTRTAASSGDVFVYDVAADTLTPVVEDVSSIESISISDDGSRLAYIGIHDSVWALWYVPADASAAPRPVSTHPLGTPATSINDGLLSGDGRWAVFATVDSAIAPFDDNPFADVFVRSIDINLDGPI